MGWRTRKKGTPNQVGTRFPVGASPSYKGSSMKVYKSGKTKIPIRKLSCADGILLYLSRDGKSLQKDIKLRGISESLRQNIEREVGLPEGPYYGAEDKLLISKEELALRDRVWEDPEYRAISSRMSIDWLPHHMTWTASFKNLQRKGLIRREKRGNTFLVTLTDEGRKVSEDILQEKKLAFDQLREVGKRLR